MQQQTWQRTRRKRKSTPLSEKRGRTRQTTHRSHANTTLRHMVNHTPPFQTIERRDKKKDEEQRRETRQQERHMVFGDNVRARKAARALPRTPTQRGRGRGTKAHAPHPRHSTMTQPRHKNTALNQQCCDKEHGGERRKEGEARRCKRGKTCEGEDPIQAQGQHTPPHPAIQRDHHTRRGTPHTRRGDQQHSRPSLTMPPTTTTAPHHPRWPHPPPRRGGSRQRIPHHTNSTDTHSPPTHHTPGNGQCMT